MARWISVAVIQTSVTPEIPQGKRSAYVPSSQVRRPSVGATAAHG